MIENLIGLTFILPFIYLSILAVGSTYYSQRIYFSLKKENPLKFKEIYGSTESIFDVNKAVSLRFFAYKYLLKIDEKNDSILIKGYKERMKKVHTLLIISIIYLFASFFHLIIIGITLIVFLMLVPA